MSLQICFRVRDRTHECSPLLYLLASAQQRSQAWSGLAEFQAWRLAEAVSVCSLGAAVRTESRAQACGEAHRETFRELLLMCHSNPASTATSQRARGFRDNAPFQLNLDLHLVSLRHTEVTFLMIQYKLTATCSLNRYLPVQSNT